MPSYETNGVTWDDARYTWDGLSLVGGALSWEDFIPRKRTYLSEMPPEDEPPRMSAPWLRV